MARRRSECPHIAGGGRAVAVIVPCRLQLTHVDETGSGGEILDPHFEGSLLGNAVVGNKGLDAGGRRWWGCALRQGLLVPVEVDAPCLVTEHEVIVGGAVPEG